TQVDEYLEGDASALRKSPEEVAADVFAAHLLMPRQAVLAAAKACHLSLASLTPEQAFILAGLFTVGYSSLLWQLAHGLQLLPEARFRELKRHQPKSIRSLLYPPSVATGLIVFGSYPVATVDM